MHRTTRNVSFTAATLTALVALSAGAQAQNVFFDDFNSGASMGTASPYFSDSSQDNGLVVKSENAFPNSSPGISADVSGNGYFLFNGTLSQNTPAGQNALYISPSFAVTQNTTYNVSFYLTNDNTSAIAQLHADINGTALGPAVSAVGDYATNGWQQFTFTFNSGTATTAALTLNDLQTNGASGNDFGVDNIRVSAVAAVPEPAFVQLGSLVVVGGAGLLLRKRRK